MLFFISPVSLTLFASSGCTGRLVTNGYDIFHLSITSLQDHCRPLARGCVLAWQGARGEGVKMGAERQELGFFLKYFVIYGFLFPLKKIFNLCPFPLARGSIQEYSRGQKEKHPVPIEAGSTSLDVRAWIQTGVTSLCSGCRSRTALPKGLSLPPGISTTWLTSPHSALDKRWRIRLEIFPATLFYQI